MALKVEILKDVTYVFYSPKTNKLLTAKFQNCCKAHPTEFFVQIQKSKNQTKLLTVSEFKTLTRGQELIGNLDG